MRDQGLGLVLKTFFGGKSPRTPDAGTHAGTRQHACVYSTPRAAIFMTHTHTHQRERERERERERGTRQHACVYCTPRAAFSMTHTHTHTQTHTHTHTQALVNTLVSTAPRATRPHCRTRLGFWSRHWHPGSRGGILYYTRSRARTYARTHACARAHTHTPRASWILEEALPFLCSRLHTRARARTHTHTQTHTHTHTHMHAHPHSHFP